MDKVYSIVLVVDFPCAIENWYAKPIDTKKGFNVAFNCLSPS